MRSVERFLTLVNFTSPIFAIFLPIVFAGAWALAPYRRARYLFLLSASYFFYGWWNPWYLVFIFGSSVLDYGSGLALGRLSRGWARRAILGISVAGNLGLLGTFKYYDFFAESIGVIARWFGYAVSVHSLGWILPVGISFYTFQSMSYTIDVYRGRVKPHQSFPEFLLFVSFFPQLLAGPIVRAAQFLPQLTHVPTLQADEVSEGLYRIARGAFRKVVFGDFLGALLVTPVVANPEHYNALSVSMAWLGFGIQIIADFGGYSDMAIGTAMLLGFKLPENFDRPLVATGPGDFWRRFHMTMSLWLRDYVFVPLLGKRPTMLRGVMALGLTAFLCGLWHGAGWHFVLFGLFHGAGLALEAGLVRLGAIPGGIREESAVWKLGAILGTTAFTALGAFFLRVPDVGTYYRVVMQWVHGGWSVQVAPTAVLILLLGWAAHVLPTALDRVALHRFSQMPSWAQGVTLAALFGVLSTVRETLTPFIYFHF